MNELKRPTFWNLFTYLSSILLSLITTCISVSNFSFESNDFKKYLIIFGFFVASAILSLIICNIIYSIRLYIYTKKLQNHYIAIKNDNEIIKYEYNKILKDYSYAQTFVKATINELKTGIIQAKDTEVRLLNHLLETIYDMNKNFIDNNIGDEKKWKIIRPIRL